MKSEITENMIENVAENARIKLSKDEKVQYTRECNEILDAFNRINEVDVTNTKPTLHPVPLTPSLRTDTTQESLSQTEALSNSLYTKRGYILGPRLVNTNNTN